MRCFIPDIQEKGTQGCWKTDRCGRRLSPPKWPFCLRQWDRDQAKSPVTFHVVRGLYQPKYAEKVIL